MEDQKDLLIKVSLNLYIKDWMTMTQYKTFRVIEDENLEYNNADVIIYGLSLLDNKYDIERGRKKVRLARGRRDNTRPTKMSSVNLPEEWANFINDFLYYKVFVEKRIKYTRPQMYAEMMVLIQAQNKEVFKS